MKAVNNFLNQSPISPHTSSSQTSQAVNPPPVPTSTYSTVRAPGFSQYLTKIRSNLSQVQNEKSFRAAAKKGDLQKIRALIGRVDINATGKYGETALCHAAANGHSEIVLVLIENHADIDHATLNGLTPLLLAAAEGHTNTVVALVEKKAKIDQVHVDGATP
ncbi:MAG: ankyrin repeat domain-containing protein [Pseudomonadota bacterium]